MTEAVRTHYDNDELVARVTKALDAISGPLSAAQLAGFDQFHARGLAATADLADLLDVQRDSLVLDAGSGLGGPSRYLAETFGCRVTGVDLTPAYVAVAKLLAERTGLNALVDYEVGDLLALPFRDAYFDTAYTQHVVMNIADRAGAYREIRRVLKPTGRFAFYDVLAADEAPPPHYPVPWAETAATSVLLTEDETRAVLTDARLAPETWADVSSDALAWFAAMKPPTPEAPNLGLVMGPRFAEMAQNFVRNLKEGRVRLMMGRAEAV